MKKQVTFFMGLFLMVLACAVLFGAAAIYNATEKLSVEPYFFQPDNLSSRRIGVPATPADLGDVAMRERLIRRYLTEYFYVVPSADNAMRRTKADGTLASMSSKAVYNQWSTDTAPQIQKMASDGKLRLVKFNSDPQSSGIVKRDGSDYWEVEYELHTWNTPNNLSAAPTVTRGVILLKIAEESGIRESIQEYGVHKWLDEGHDPVTLFKFRVDEVAGL